LAQASLAQGLLQPRIQPTTGGFSSNSKMQRVVTVHEWCAPVHLGGANVRIRAARFGREGDPGSSVDVTRRLQHELQANGSVWLVASTSCYPDPAPLCLKCLTVFFDGDNECTVGNIVSGVGTSAARYFLVQATLAGATLATTGRALLPASPLACGLALGAAGVAALACHHRSHASCIQQWRSCCRGDGVPPTCPLCRATLEEQPHADVLDGGLESRLEPGLQAAQVAYPFAVAVMEILEDIARTLAEDGVAPLVQSFGVAFVVRLWPDTAV